MFGIIIYKSPLKRRFKIPTEIVFSFALTVCLSKEEYATTPTATGTKMGLKENLEYSSEPVLPLEYPFWVAVLESWRQNTRAFRFILSTQDTH